MENSIGNTHHPFAVIGSRDDGWVRSSSRVRAFNAQRSKSLHCASCQILPDAFQWNSLLNLAATFAFGLYLSKKAENSIVSVLTGHFSISSLFLFRLNDLFCSREHHIITARIRRMTGGYIFTLSTLAGEGSTPSQVWVRGGYPISGLGGGGTPSQV